MKKICDEAAPLGESAIVQRTEVIETAMYKEKAIEGIKKALENIASDQDFGPIIFARVNKELVATACEIKDGVFVLPNLELPSKISLIWKRRRVRSILKSINKVLRRDIGEVTEVALMRKTDDQLKEIQKALKKKKKVGLKNRIGCIFLEVGDETVQI